MNQAYQLELRVLIRQKNGRFFAEGLETEGVVSTDTHDETLAAYLAALYVAFDIGEPYFRKAPRRLLKLWQMDERLARAEGIERFRLNVEAYREEPAGVLPE